MKLIINAASLDTTDETLDIRLNKICEIT